jgi:hypothetical protein
MMRFSLFVLLALCLVGCDSTVENDASIEGDWTGSANGRITYVDEDKNDVNDDIELEITFSETNAGEQGGKTIYELSGTATLRIFNGSGNLKETLELNVSGSRSANTVESAFSKPGVDTLLYNGSVKNGGDNIRGTLNWLDRYDNTSDVKLSRQ